MPGRHNDFGNFTALEKWQEDSELWAAELQKSGLQIPAFKSLVTGRDAPPSREMQILGTDVVLNGKKVDVYYYPHDEEIYLQLKN